MSQMVSEVQSNLEGVNLEELRIRLNRNPDLFVRYPKLRIGETVTNEELSEMLSRIIIQRNLNPTLKDVDVSSPNLQGANLSGANLNGMDFSGKNMENCKLKLCDLVNAKFNNVSATGAEFMYSDLTGAEFIDAELSETSFQRAILIGANFSGADMNDISLDNADMTRANVSNANLLNAVVDGTNMQDIIYNNFTEFPFLDDAINVPEGLFEFEDEEIDEEPPQGVAFEIHNVFQNIDMDKYREIVKTVAKESGPRGRHDIASIKRVFEAIIVRNFPMNNRALAKTKLDAILQRLQNSGKLNQDAVMKLVSDTIEFVLDQPTEFRVFYVTSFIQDCYHAYSQPSGQPYQTEQGMSCVKGIVERFVWIVGDAAQAMCTETCTPLYQQLLNVFGKSKLDLNELTQQWNSEVLETDAFHNKANKTKEQVKQSFIQYMKDKYSAVGMWIPSIQALVEKRADELDYAFEGRMFGGRRLRNRRNLRKKTARKYRKSQNKKKAKKHTLKKSRKNVTRKR